MKKVLFTLFLLLITQCFVFAQDDILIDGEPCGIHGSARQNTIEYDQNVFKNRYNIPSANEFDKSITLDKLLSGGEDKDRFGQEKAADITAYVYDVKFGGTESCNCKTGDKLFRDTHIEITPASNQTDPSKRFIVEVTPRLRQIMLQKGIDWSTEQLKSLKGRMVRFQGWMFYDHSHESQSFSTNPKNNGGKNWRATCWEIHPLTNIEPIEPLAEENASSDGANEQMPAYLNTINPPDNNPPNNNNMNNATTAPLNLLIIILIGAILGATGQGIRVIVGLKKMYDEANKESAAPDSMLKYKQIALSLIIAFAIGAMAGILFAIGNPNIQFTKEVIIAFMGAGYAGTDFIEGFVKKYPNVKG